MSRRWWCRRAESDEEKVERFLARLGLVDLQVLQLEDTLRGSLPENEKEPTARRLADLYAERLMASSGDKPRYDDTVKRISKLLESFPQANTTALQVMLLQADYNRAESLIASWIGDPQDTTARNEAQQILNRITPQLIEHQQTLNQQVDELAKQLDNVPEGDEQSAREQQLRRVQGVAARATYFAAWSNYYLALVTDAAEKAAPYVRARNIFLHLLGFDAELPKDLQPEWLGLESIWRARAVIGLGLSEAACGDFDACERCFDALEHSSVPTEIKDQAPYWRVRALLGAGQLARVETYARAAHRLLPTPSHARQGESLRGAGARGIRARLGHPLGGQRDVGQPGAGRAGPFGPAGRH